MSSPHELGRNARAGTVGAPVDRPVTMRVCDSADERALRLLAGLDSAPPLKGTILAAQIEDELLAAISIETGRVVADPFSHTAALVELLRARAAQLESGKEPKLTHGSGPLGRARAWLPRRAQEASS